MKLNLGFRKTLAFVLLIVSGIVLGYVVYTYGIDIVTLTFAPGPNAVAPYVEVSGGSMGFSMTIEAVNASGALYYDVLVIASNGTGYLSVAGVSTSGPNIVRGMTLYVGNCTLPVIPNTGKSCQLGPGVYEASLLVTFNAPVRAGEEETVTINLAFSP